MSATLSRDPGIESYYRLHAGIYDATRWSFLFGRQAIVAAAAAVQPAPRRILEVGCGTGRNLAALARRFPAAEITGLDVSAEMLAIARRKLAPYGDRIRWQQRAYDAPLGPKPGFDLVLFSYALSMFNPGFETALAAARRDLAPGGCVATVDFHRTRRTWFRRWMGVNHVRMDGHLRPALAVGLQTVHDEVHAAYGGLWEYFLWIGRAPGSSD